MHILNEIGFAKYVNNVGEKKWVIQPVRGAFWGQRATSPLVPVSGSAHGAPSAPSASLSPPPRRSCYHPDTYKSRRPTRGADL